MSFESMLGIKRKSSTDDRILNMIGRRQAFAERHASDTVLHNVLRHSPLPSMLRQPERRSSVSRQQFMQSRPSFMNRIRDTDGDGVPNWLDCMPFNRRQQGIGDWFRKAKGYVTEKIQPTQPVQQPRSQPRPVPVQQPRLQPRPVPVQQPIYTKKEIIEYGAHSFKPSSVDNMKLLNIVPGDEQKSEKRREKALISREERAKKIPPINSDNVVQFLKEINPINYNDLQDQKFRKQLKKRSIIHLEIELEWMKNDMKNKNLSPEARNKLMILKDVIERKKRYAKNPNF